MRAATTSPIPGTVVSSFSVAVLMSMFPSGIFSFACDPVVAPELARVIDASDFVTEEKTTGESGGAERDRVSASATKELKPDGFCAWVFTRPVLTPQAPIVPAELRFLIAAALRARFANSLVPAAWP